MDFAGPVSVTEFDIETSGQTDQALVLLAVRVRAAVRAGANVISVAIGNGTWFLPSIKGRSPRPSVILDSLIKW